MHLKVLHNVKINGQLYLTLPYLPYQTEIKGLGCFWIINVFTA